MTTAKREPKRCFYDLNDRRLKILDLTPASQAVVEERYKCAGCYHLSPPWHEHPEPISVVVDRVTSAWVESIGDIALMALDAELLEALAPYCRGMLFGKVLLDRGDGRPEPTRFATVTAPKPLRIQSDRGRYCRHSQYPCCGVCINSIGWAKGAIVERTLDDRLVYVDQDGHILVADELVEKLELKGRFPKLWLQRVDVVPEPLDKETLPGDPGWDGVLRRTYHASLGATVHVPFVDLGDRVVYPDEQAIYGEALRRLNEELAAIGAETASRDKGRHGCCALHARGFDTGSLKRASLRAFGDWRVRAWFSVSLHEFEGNTLVEDFKVEDGRVEPTGAAESLQRIRDQARIGEQADEGSE